MVESVNIHLAFEVHQKKFRKSKTASLGEKIYVYENKGIELGRANYISYFLKIFSVDSINKQTKRKG